MTAPAVVTVGAGKDNPQGRRVAILAAADPVRALADFLDKIPPRREAWWSPETWGSDYREARSWESACAAVVDLDYHDADGEHSPTPEQGARALADAARTLALPGSLWHATPRGGRLVAVLLEPVTDGALRDQAVCGFAELVRGALADLSLLAEVCDGKAVNGLVVDRTFDRARFFYAPRAAVNGAKRTAAVLVMREGPYAAEALAESAPPEPVQPAPPPKAAKSSAHEATSDLKEAIARFNAAHPCEWPKSDGACPACGHKGCFGTLPEDAFRWSCFSGNHERDSNGCGVKGSGCWHGDALDLAAHAAGLARVDLLRRGGFLSGGSSANAGHDERLTDLGNARRLVRLHGRDLRFTGAHGWLVWDGRRWEPDGTGEHMRRAKATAESIFDEAKAAGATDQAKEFASWAIKSQKADRLAAMLTLAKTEPGIAARAEEFDQDPWLLNVRNGTIDLRTGELRGHRREDLITRLASVAYDPKATCPTFDAFLARVQPDGEVRAYLQRRAGYWLTGDAREQTFDVDYGTGANGKSTFMETAADMLGDYAVTTPFSTFTMKRDRGEASNDLAALAGARLAAASEPPEGARLNVAAVKQLTGGDRISARFHYREFFAFVPQFKIVLVANHRPHIPETTEAAWRRVLLVPWTVTIPKPERDKTLRARLRKELPGILRWAVEGCRAWQRDGLDPPAAVQAATEAYRQEEDPLAAFLAERCEVGRGFLVPSADLERAYGAWAKESDRDALTMRALGPRLREKGFERSKELGERSWKGLRLRPAEDASDTSGADSGNPPYESPREESSPERASNASDVSSAADCDPASEATDPTEDVARAAIHGEGVRPVTPADARPARAAHRGGSPTAAEPTRHPWDRPGGWPCGCNGRDGGHGEGHIRAGSPRLDLRATADAVPAEDHGAPITEDNGGGGAAS